jgi:hypothetical protein
VIKGVIGMTKRQMGYWKARSGKVFFKDFDSTWSEKERTEE